MFPLFVCLIFVCFCLYFCMYLLYLFEFFLFGFPWLFRSWCCLLLCFHSKKKESKVYTCLFRYDYSFLLFFLYFVFFLLFRAFISISKEYFYWNKINANHSFYFSFFSDVNSFSIFSLRILLSYSLSTWGVRHFLRVVNSDCDS